MKSYFLKILSLFVLYIFSAISMEPKLNEVELKKYEQKIREDHEDLINEIKTLHNASILDKKLRLEEKSYNELNRATNYYTYTSELVEKSKKLLESLNEEDIIDDKKQVKKIVYEEIYQLSLSQFNIWEKWYQMEKQLSTRNPRGGNTFTIPKNKG